MSGALKFVKVIVAPAPTPAAAALYGSPHVNSSLCVAAQGRGKPAYEWKSAYKFQVYASPPGAPAGPRTISADFG